MDQVRQDSGWKMGALLLAQLVVATLFAAVHGPGNVFALNRSWLK